jgi:hypothetical protein
MRNSFLAQVPLRMGIGPLGRLHYLPDGARGILTGRRRRGARTPLGTARMRRRGAGTEVPRGPRGLMGRAQEPPGIQ